MNQISPSIGMAVWTLLASLTVPMSPLLFAQESAATEQVVGPMTLPIKQFQTLLTPRKKAALEDLATKWQGELEQCATRVAKARVMSQRNADPVSRGQVSQLMLEQDAIAERYDVVIDALEKKGGDVAEHRAYLEGVTSQNPIENPMLLKDRAIKWLQSPEGGLSLALKVGIFLGVLLVARFLAGMAASIVDRALRMSKIKVTELLASFFVNTARNVVTGLGLVIALSALGVPVGPVLAAMGAVGFIVGFALQDTLGNFAAGVMILFYRPYDLEDVVTVAGVTGKVQAMSLVSTTLTTPDNQIVVVPNQSIWGGIITNVTGSATRRIDLTFGIGYSDDVHHAQRVLEQLVESHPLILKDPAPVIRVHELADSSVNFICRPWAKTADYWSVYWDLTRMVKESFDAEGISIPFPQQDVYMHTVASPAIADQRAA